MGASLMRCDRRQLLTLASGALGLAAGHSLAGRALQANAAADALRIGLISDLNSSYGSTSYIPQVQQGLTHLLALKPALVVCAGDMVAGQKKGLSARRLDQMWEAFARTILLPVRRQGIPFLPAVGNHDGAPGFSADRQAVRRFWKHRRQALGLRWVDSADFPFHYSVLDQDVFWLVWDASSSRVPEAQLLWARRQLMGAEARQARLRLVVGHLPLAGISQGRDRPGEVLTEHHRIKRLLQETGVQGYISGHQHAWYPASEAGLDLIQLGAMGSGPRLLIGDRRPRPQSFTTLDLDWQEHTLEETSYDAATGMTLDWDSLPEQLQGHRGTLMRNRSLRPLTQL
ncbi:metallophosphoesterase family protein [Synechococcus sp. MIT S9451]|jgi:hypothetical protein|uniref:metallophosphoesterase family protein n=1 Tax=Synechococcus sp. MIT S9451 TaxID=3082543 RepID=UPI0039B61C54